MKQRLILISFILTLVGCQSTYRYGAQAGSEQSRESRSVRYRSEASSVMSLQSREMIKLGVILQQYLGKASPFSSRGGGGIDCSEFTRRVFDSYASIRLPRTAAEQFTSGTPVDRRDLAYGDLVFFMTEGDQISHVGVFIGFDEFIHSSSSRGVIISPMQEPYWRQRFVGARRILNPTE